MDEALSQYRRRRQGEREVFQLFELVGFEPGEAIERSRKLVTGTTTR